MTNEEDMEKKKGSVIFSLVSYVSINCIRFTGIISAQSTPTNNGVQSIYFVGEGQGDCNISTHSRTEAAAAKDLLVNRFKEFQHTGTRRWLLHTKHLHRTTNGRFNTQPPEGGCLPHFYFMLLPIKVSTHSHPKVAAKTICGSLNFFL